MQMTLAHRNPRFLEVSERELELPFLLLLIWCNFWTKNDQKPPVHSLFFKVRELGWFEFFRSSCRLDINVQFLTESCFGLKWPHMASNGLKDLKNISKPQLLNYFKSFRNTKTPSQQFFIFGLSWPRRPENQFLFNIENIKIILCQVHNLICKN